MTYEEFKKRFQNFDEARKSLIPAPAQINDNRWVLSDIEGTMVSYVLILTLHIEDDRVVYSEVVRVDEELAEIWGVDELTIRTAAFLNAEKMFPAELIKIGDALGISAENDPAGNTYILTNSVRWHGAAAIFYVGMMDKLYRKFGNYSIIPSSIDETIIVPDSMGMSNEDLTAMLKDVNDSIVKPEYRLSYNVYHYTEAGID